MHPRTIAAQFLRLRRRPTHRFPKRGFALAAPDQHGVYIITDSKGKVVHVGRTIRGRRGLYQRLRNHIQGQSSFVLSYLNGDGETLRDGYGFQYLEVNDDKQRAFLEALAIGRLCPSHIGIGVNTKKRK